MNNAFFTRSRVRLFLLGAIASSLFVGVSWGQEASDYQITRSTVKQSPFSHESTRLITNQSLKIKDDGNYFVNPFPKFAPPGSNVFTKEIFLVPIEPEHSYLPHWDDERLTCYGPFFKRERLVARVKPIENVDFAGVDLEGSIFKGKFVNCSFANANLSHVDAREAEFVDCDFTGADLGFCKGLRVSLATFLTLRAPETGLFNLRGADLVVYNDSPELTVVNLGRSDLSYAKITKEIDPERGGKFYFVLNDCRLDYYQSPVVLSDGRPRLENDDALDSLTLPALSATKRDPRSDLVMGLTISGVDQTPTDLSGYTFVDCVFDQCDFDAIKIDDAIFVNCTFTASVKNLSEEKLQTTINRKEKTKANLIKTQ